VEVLRAARALVRPHAASHAFACAGAWPGALLGTSSPEEVLRGARARADRMRSAVPLHALALLFDIVRAVDPVDILRAARTQLGRMQAAVPLHALIKCVKCCPSC